MKLSSQFRPRQGLWGRAGSNVWGQKWRMCSGFSSVCLSVCPPPSFKPSEQPQLFQQTKLLHQMEFLGLQTGSSTCICQGNSCSCQKENITRPVFLKQPRRKTHHSVEQRSLIIILEDLLLMKSMWTGTHAQLVPAAELFQTHRACLLRRENVSLDRYVCILLPTIWRNLSVLSLPEHHPSCSSNLYPGELLFSKHEDYSGSTVIRNKRMTFFVKRGY